MPPIVVVGAGIGGLAAAIHLASAGEEVLMLEQNPQVGGKMGQMCAAGFRWDTGPSVITMRHVLDDLFAAAGRRLGDHLTLLPLDPLTRYFYPDGTILDASQDVARTATQLAHLDQRDGRGYRAFLRYAARIHAIAGPLFLYNRPPSWRSFLGTSPFNILKVDPLRSMDDAIRSYVHSPQARQLLGRFATYAGASPYQAPATLNVIAHVELNQGVWYPQGGVYTIAVALAKLSRELGVTIRTHCPVRRIVSDGPRVQGVLLADGTIQPAQAVVANVDVATVYAELLPGTPQTERRLQAYTGLPASSSGFILLLGVEGEHAQLAHHNIFFSSDYRAEFVDIFERGVPPQEPTVYVSITAKTDPSHAPAGSENWFVLVNVPPLGPHYDWDVGTTIYRDRVLARLAQFGLDVRGRIRVERTLTPLDLARMSGAHRGALYGQSANDRMAAFRRPHNRASGMSGLYFAGGTTHPGGGVPLVMLSGKVAAEMLLADRCR